MNARDNVQRIDSAPCFSEAYWQDVAQAEVLFADRKAEIKRDLMAAVMRREADAPIKGFMVSSYPKKGEHQGSACEMLAEATDTSDINVPTMADVMAFLMRIAFKEPQAIEMIELLAEEAAEQQANKELP